MGKRCAEKQKKKSAVAALRKEMPFQPKGSDVGSLPRNYKAKQRSWILSGLKHIRAPIAIATLVSLLFAVPNLEFKPLEHLECFSGKMAVTKAEWAAGRSAMPFDLETDPERMDLMSPMGFANALYYACSLEPGSGHLSAPVCSSWVFMSRGSTLRSRARPLGRRDAPSVWTGNVLAARAFVLLLICSAKAVWWMLEQPGSSLLEFHPLFQQVVRMVGSRRLSINMSDYGAPTKKRTLLYSSHSAVDHLSEFQVEPRLEKRQMVVHYTDSSGKSRVQGGRDLKSSQEYPKEFGVAVSKCRTKFLKRHRRAAKQFLRRARKTPNDYDRRSKINRSWVNSANLQPVIDFLSGK